MKNQKDPALALLVLFASLASSSALALDTQETPFPGGVLKHHSDGTQDFWVLRMDLCAPGVSVRATAEDERGRTALSYANLIGAQAAINGDFTDPSNSFSTDGPAAHDGAFWTRGGADHTYVAPIAFGPAHVDIPHHNNTSGAPPWAKEVVGGHPTLLDNGNVVGNPGDPLCTNRHPRTALGITQDHRTLIVLVVDGRRTGAAGMTCDELAFVLASEGAFDAVNMDGGGSSTMVVNGAVKNRPSDGQPRVVGNHLGFFATGSGPAPQCPDFVDPVCGGDADRQQCTGTNILACTDGAPTANGDCGFFGAGCSVEGGAAHCVHPFCMLNLDGGETGTFCKDDTNILGTCNLGVYEEGDCSFFGATCSEKGGAGHCVHPFCPLNLNGEEDGSFCKDGATLASCSLGQYVERTCASGCVVDEPAVAARCGEDPAPPPPVGEGEGEGDTSSGEGEGESEPDDDGGGRDGAAHGRLPSSTEPSCASTPSSSCSLLALALLVGRARTVRRRARCDDRFRS
jgi:hypothetical protein